MNKFGILTEATIEQIDENGVAMQVPIIDIIITKQAVGIASSVALEDLHIGDFVNVEILGKKFELKDKKISAIGKVVTDTVASLKTGAPSVTDEDDEDDDDIIEDDDVVGDAEEDEERTLEEDDEIDVELDREEEESLIDLEDEFDDDDEPMETIDESDVDADKDDI